MRRADGRSVAAKAKVTEVILATPTAVQYDAFRELAYAFRREHGRCAQTAVPAVPRCLEGLQEMILRTSRLVDALGGEAQRSTPRLFDGLQDDLGVAA